MIAHRMTPVPTLRVQKVTTPSRREAGSALQEAAACAASQVWSEQRRY